MTEPGPCAKLWRMRCQLCERQRGRRDCPALRRRICSQCCGTKRLVEIDCPRDCPYLSASREHPPAVKRREQMRDMMVLLSTAGEMTREQGDLLFATLGMLVDLPSDDLVRTTDDEVAEAAASLAATIETAERGLIYEHRPSSLAAERLARALRERLKTLEDKPRPGIRRDLAVALRALEKVAREARKHLPGGSEACLGLARRVRDDWLEKTEDARRSAIDKPSSSTIIIP